MLAAGVAQVPQQGGLFGNLTVRDNMLVGGYLMRRDRRALRRRLDELAEAFPVIADRADDKASDLSGGQRRIVEFARALVTSPQSSCSTSRRSAWTPRPAGGLRQHHPTMNELGVTVLMVEQNVRFGLTLATHGVVMERGGCCSPSPRLTCCPATTWAPCSSAPAPLRRTIPTGDQLA